MSASSTIDSDALTAAITAAIVEPAREALWDAATSRARALNDPDPITAAFGEVLAQDLTAETASCVGRLAVAWHDEWSGEPAPLEALLARVLERDAGGAEWAFERYALVLSQAARWTELLALYDRAIGATGDDARRKRLLDEAAKHARDFAGDDERAIGYLQKLRGLGPDSAGNSAALERLFADQGKHRELVELWRARLATLPPDEARATRTKIAAHLIDPLDHPAAAVTELEGLLRDGAADEACPLLERVVARDSAPREVRSRAAALLREHYATAQRAADIVRVIELELEFADPAERRALLHELTERLVRDERLDDAVAWQAQLVAAEPGSNDVIERMRELCERAGAHGAYADALVTAASGLPGETARRLGLLIEAARVRRDRAGDPRGASALYLRVLATPDAPADAALEAARRLDALLEGGDRAREQVEVLFRLAALEPAGADVRAALGRAARIAGRLGDIDRACTAWEQCLARDATDREAIDALVVLYEGAERWDALVGALRARIAPRAKGNDTASRKGRKARTVEQPRHLVSDAERRADLVRIAQIEAENLGAFDRAADDWSEVEKLFGQDAETLGARVALCERLGRWDELTQLLERAAERAEPARRAEVLCKLGDVLRERLGAFERATACYARVLSGDATNATARAALRALVEHEACAQPAVAALARAYASTGDWAAMLEIREPRLATATAAGDRAAILMEAAAIEERAGDLVSAQRSARRAFALDPGDAVVERDVLRLAEARGDWAGAVEAYDAAIAASTDATQRAELELRAGAVLEERAGDARGALAAFARVHAERPERLDAALAVARLGAKLGAWDTAAGALVATSLARRAIGAELVTALATAAGDAQAWDAACAGLRAALEPTTARADSPEVIASLWATLGRWHRDHRGDLDAARDALARAVRSDGRDASALRALAELQRRAPDRALVDTLLALAEAVRDEMAALFEAARVALETLTDVALARAILERLRDRARESQGKGTLVEQLASALAAPHEVDDAAERAERRLSIALVLRALGDREGCTEALRSNLAEAPGHAGSVRALADLLTDEGEDSALAELYVSQAAKLEGAGERARAAVLHARAGEVLERLGEADRAIDARTRAVDLSREPSADSLDALARLYAARGEHGASAGWLERLAEVTREPDARAQLAARIARERALSGEHARAEAALEGLLAEQPGALAVRAQLAEIHRTQHAWDKLARLLEQGLERAPLDDDARLAALREAGALRYERLGDAAGAVALFERAVALAPGDAPTRSALGAALADAGRSAEARAVFETLLAEYGRRRTPARAQVHFALARIARGEGRTDDALAQLDAAAGIDVEHAGILRALGDAARDAGQPDRAERAYRSLLMVLGRKGAAATDVHRVEVLVELHALAAAMDQARRSREFLESAFELAAQDDAEARALERVLAAAGRRELLARALRARLAGVKDPAQRADALGQLADVLAATPEHADEALGVRLDALALAPRAAAMHEAARSLAQSLGAVERYALRLERLADEAEAAGDAGLCFDLLLRLGEVTERDLGRIDRAGEILARAERIDAGPIRVALALERVYGALGDAVGQARVLLRLVAADDPDVDEPRRADALCRLGEIQLGAAATRADGARAIADALDRAATLEDAARRAVAARSAAVLARAVRDEPDDDALLALYERAARAHGEAQTLFDALERRARRDGAPASLAREAAEHALSLGETGRGAELLVRVSLAPDAGASGPWAFAQLAMLRRDAGDTPSVLALFRRAVESGEALTEWPAWALELASLAAGEGGDLALAADTYERLRRRDPTQRGYWEPLLEVYRRLGDDDRREQLIKQVADHVFDGAERNRLRMERARILIKRPERWDEAVSALRYVLGENPGDAEAAALLKEILERGSRGDELAELLARQFDTALARRDAELAGSIALQLGPLVAAARRTEALGVYRRALALAPGQPALLDALVALQTDDDPAAERADVLERLLAVQTGARAVASALKLAVLREASGDLRASAAALARGLVAAPSDAGLLARLVRLRVRAGQPREAIDEVTRAIDDAKAPPAELFALRAEARAACGDDAGAAKDLEQACALPGGAAHAKALAAMLETLRASAARRHDVTAEGEATARLATLLARSGEPDRAATLLDAWVARAPKDRAALHALVDVQAAAGRWDRVVEACRLLLDVEEGRGRVQAVAGLAEAFARKGTPDEARPELEWVHQQMPWDETVRTRLRAVYERAGAHRELAALAASDAEYAQDDATCFKHLVRAADLWLHAANDPAAAIAPLEQAARLRPTDPEAVALRAEALERTGRVDEARAALQTAIDAYKGRRSRDLSTLQLRMARLVRGAGDARGSLAWFGSALENDMQSGAVASEYADVAIEAGENDLALKALRALTLMKAPAPMGRAVAFLRQGEIALRQRDGKKAAFFARKALSEDPALKAAEALLREAGE